jgi:hypothetical protein
MSLRKIREERRRMLELVLVIILIGLFINVLATSLYSLFPNTIFWVAFSLLAVLVVAAYFVFASRLLATDLKKTIPFVFAVNVKEVCIPEFGLYGSPMSLASFFFREIVKETPGLKGKIEKARRDDFDFYEKFFLDLTTFLVVKQLSFGFCWLYERPLEYSFRRFQRAIDRPSKKVKRADLLALLRNNTFSKLRDPQLFDMTLPPNTTISINEPKNKWSIVMENRYCRITIGVSLGGSEGFWGLADVPVQFSSMKGDDFDTLDFFIDFEVKFKVLMSMSRQMKDYYDWAEGVFERLRNDFDWRAQVEKIPTVLKALGSEYFTL